MGVSKFFCAEAKYSLLSCRFFIYLVCVCVCVCERERERGREREREKGEKEVNTIGPLPWQLFWELYAM